MKLQFDDNGNHRIVDGESKGSWSLYQHASFLSKDGKDYTAFTAYYDFPKPEIIYEIVPVSTEVEIVSGTRPK
jgi:hypothetical protein